jgi:hypothetical protein
LPFTVFPFLGDIGYSDEGGYAEIVHENKDGTYRRFREANFNDRIIELNFEDYSQAESQTISDFCNARQSSTSDYEFYLYNPKETNTLDPTGGNATGRHRARLAPNTRVKWTSIDNCSFSTTIAFKLLD